MSEADHDNDAQLTKDERVDAARKRFEEMKKKMKKKKKAHSIDFSKAAPLAPTPTVSLPHPPPSHPPVEVQSISSSPIARHQTILSPVQTSNEFPPTFTSAAEDAEPADTVTEEPVAEQESSSFPPADLSPVSNPIPESQFAPTVSDVNPQDTVVETEPKSRGSLIASSSAAPTELRTSSSSKRYQLTPEDLFGPSPNSPENTFLSVSSQSPQINSFPASTSPRVSTSTSQFQPAQSQSASVRNSLIPKVDPLDLFGPSSLSDPFAPSTSGIEPPKSQNSFPAFSSAAPKSNPVAAANPKEPERQPASGNSLSEPRKASTTFEDLFGPSQHTNFDDIFSATSTGQSIVEKEQDTKSNIFEGEEEEIKSDVEEYFGMTLVSPTRKSFEDVLQVVEPTPAAKPLTAEDLFGTASPEPISATQDDLFGPYSVPEAKLEPIAVTNAEQLIQPNVETPAIQRNVVPIDGLLEVDLNEPDDPSRFSESVPESVSEPKPQASLISSIQQESNNVEPIEAISLVADDALNPSLPTESMGGQLEKSAEKEKPKPLESNDSAAEIEKLKKIIAEQEAIIKRQREENTTIKLSRMDLNDRIAELEEIIDELKAEKESSPQESVKAEDVTAPVLDSQVNAPVDEVIASEPAPPAAQSSEVLDSLFNESSAAPSTAKVDVHDLFPDTTAKLESLKGVSLPLTSGTSAETNAVSKYLAPAVPEQTPSQPASMSDSKVLQSTASGISDFRERLLVWKGWQIDMTQWDGATDAPKVAI